MFFNTVMAPAPPKRGGRRDVVHEYERRARLTAEIPATQTRLPRPRHACGLTAPGALDVVRLSEVSASVGTPGRLRKKSVDKARGVCYSI